MIASRALGIAAVGFVSLASAMGIGRFAFTPLLPLMQQQGLLDLRQGAWLAAANYFGYLLGAMACTRWRVRPELAARGGLIGVAASTFAMGLGGGIVAWLSWRFLAGIASAFVLIGISSWALQSLAAAQRPNWAGAVFAGVGIGIALAGLLGLATALLHEPLALAWMLLGALAAIVALATWRSLAPVQGGSQRSAAPNARVGARAPTWRLVFAYGLYGYGYILPATFLPAIARQQFTNPVLFGTVWPVFGLAAALSTLLVARVWRDAPPHKVWAVAQLIIAVGILLPLLSSSLPALLVAAVCVGGTFVVVTLAAVQEARVVAGTEAPHLIAAMTTAFAAGQLLGPLTIGPLGGAALSARHSTPVAASLVACAALVIGAALLKKSMNVVTM